jgi:hypothetical protein
MFDGVIPLLRVRNKEDGKFNCLVKSLVALSFQQGCVLSYGGSWIPAFAGMIAVCIGMTTV